MPGDLVLLTGASGHVGYLILIELLNSGYSVRAAVRSESKADKIRALPSLKGIAPSATQLSFITVPDIAAPGAYDEAARGVTYIIHVAAPVPGVNTVAATSDAPIDREELFVKTAVATAVGMLDSARKAGGVRRIVFTNSGVGVVPLPYVMGLAPDQATRVFDAEDRMEVPPPPYEMDILAYGASKAAMLKAIEAYVREEDVGFDVVNMIVNLVMGRDECVADVADLTSRSSNAVLAHFLTGKTSDVAWPGNGVYGKDVAVAHVRALDPLIRGNQAFVLTQVFQWDEAIAIAKKHYPEAMAAGILRDDGQLPTTELKWDISKVCWDHK